MKKNKRLKKDYDFVVVVVVVLMMLTMMILFFFFYYYYYRRRFASLSFGFKNQQPTNNK